jgi:hypothetical protein
VVDHLCRNRRCVNPDHLRVVTNHENLTAPGSLSPAAGVGMSVCAKGHQITGDKGKRRCLECHRLNSKARYEALAASPEFRARRAEMARSKRAAAKLLKEQAA